MLNISEHRINNYVDDSAFRSLKRIHKTNSKSILLRLVGLMFILAFVVMFLPWTQTVNSNGELTTLRPDQRPQTIHSIIPGRIEKWYVQEGDLVKKGDTILYLSEIKEGYFDPQLLDRTEEQIKAKEMSVSSYMEKVKALDNQIDGLIANRRLDLEKTANYLEQAILAVRSDSIDLVAAEIKYSTSLKQFERYKQMREEGLKSLTDVENRELTLQKSLADKIAAKNKLLSSRNKVINAKIELNTIRNKYNNDIAKAESDKFSAMSNLYDTEATVTKMQNEFSNYSVRSGYYYITAPQDGFITKVIKTGIGETLKEGQELLSIMPASYDLVVQMYIDPIDLPLIKKGENVRIQFEGWPAIVFSGWPNTSYGTYGGKVYAIDKFISENGKYRILVEPDTQDVSWPKELQVGSATKNLLLLDDVPVWFEIWRKINDFPPNFPQEKSKESVKE